MEQKEQLKIYRAWQQMNPSWELICDIKDRGASLYIQWDGLPAAEKRLWRRVYREDPQGAFQVFGTNRCKVKQMCLAPDLELHEIMDWPEGFCVLVFKTGKA
jgi:hypothetical protein